MEEDKIIVKVRIHKRKEISQKESNHVEADYWGVDHQMIPRKVGTH